MQLYHATHETADLFRDWKLLNEIICIELEWFRANVSRWEQRNAVIHLQHSSTRKEVNEVCLVSEYCLFACSIELGVNFSPGVCTNMRTTISGGAQSVSEQLYQATTLPWSVATPKPSVRSIFKAGMLWCCIVKCCKRRTSALPLKDLWKRGRNFEWFSNHVFDGTICTSNVGISELDCNSHGRKLRLLRNLSLLVPLWAIASTKEQMVQKKGHTFAVRSFDLKLKSSNNEWSLNELLEWTVKAKVASILVNG